MIKLTIINYTILIKIGFKLIRKNEFWIISDCFRQETKRHWLLL